MTTNLKKLDKICLEIKKHKEKKKKQEAALDEIKEKLASLYDSFFKELKKTKQKDWSAGGKSFYPSWKKYFSVTDNELLREVLTKSNLQELIRINPKAITAQAKTWIAKEVEKNPSLAFDSDKLNDVLLKKFGITFFEKLTVGMRGEKDEESDS